MIYNEYAQVLEAKNPATGCALQARGPERHRLQRSVGRDGDAPGPDLRLGQVAQGRLGNADIATKFLKASFKGWVYCRDNAQKCVDIVLKNGSQLGASHQAWQMNEINALIWPSPNGIGLMDKALYDQTVKIATTYQVLKARPGRGRVPHRPRAEGARRPGHVARHQGRELPEGHGRRSRRAATRSCTDAPRHEGRPMRVGPRRFSPPRTRARHRGTGCVSSLAALPRAELSRHARRRARWVT